MRLENTVALIGGELLNSPFVSEFSNIVLDLKSLKRGDLFIAFEEKSIAEAILKGAYGIVFQKPTQITDNEIAWIQVKDLHNALIRLLRFELLTKDISVYSCDEITLKLALQVVTENHFIILNKDIKNSFKKLSNIEEKSTILFSPEITPMDIFTDIKELPKNPTSLIKIIEHTLFETSFIYHDVFYERQSITPFFIPYLEQLLFFLRKYDISFRLKKFTSIEHFETLFINKNLETKEFGATDQVLIFEKSESLITQEILFLEKYATWAKKIYIFPQSLQNNLSIELDRLENVLFYHSKEDIEKRIKSQKFHFAFIAGSDKSIFNNPHPKQVQLTLNF